MAHIQLPQQNRWGWVSQTKEIASLIPVEKLESMRLIGDELADEAISALIEKYPTLESSHSSQLTVAMIEEIKLYHSHDENQDPRIARLLRSVFLVPDWVDRSLIQKGQLFYIKYSASSAFAMLYYSLIGGFSAPKIVRTLDETKYLTKASSPNVTFRRLLETFEMVVDCVASDTAMDCEAVGWHAVLKVRLLHARVRRMIRLRSSSNNWDVKEFGVPINQEDMMGTLLSFSINVIHIVQKIGAPWLTSAEMEACLHLWRYIGYLIGVQEETNPCSSLERANGATESVVLHLLHPNKRSQEVAGSVLRALVGRAPAAHWSLETHAG